MSIAVRTFITNSFFSGCGTRYPANSTLLSRCSCLSNTKPEVMIDGKHFRRPLLHAEQVSEGVVLLRNCKGVRIRHVLFLCRGNPKNDKKIRTKANRDSNFKPTFFHSRRPQISHTARADSSFCKQVHECPRATGPSPSRLLAVCAVSRMRGWLPLECVHTKICTRKQV